MLIKKNFSKSLNIKRSASFHLLFRSTTQERAWHLQERPWLSPRCLIDHFSLLRSGFFQKIFGLACHHSDVFKPIEGLLSSAVSGVVMLPFVMFTLGSGPAVLGEDRGRGGVGGPEFFIRKEGLQLQLYWEGFCHWYNYTFQGDALITYKFRNSSYDVGLMLRALLTVLV